MEKMYRGQSLPLLAKSAESPHHTWWEGSGKNLVAWLITIAIAVLFVWTVVGYLQIPYVHFSTSQGKVVTVFATDGKNLPLSPLPQKYKFIHVE